MKTHFSNNFIKTTYAQLYGGPLPVPENSRSLPPVFKYGDGALLLDFDNNRYTDFNLGGGSLILGHAPHNVILAVKKYSERGILPGSINRGEVEFAQQLKSFYPQGERSIFFNSQITALLSAISCARSFTKKDKIITFDLCKHTNALKEIFGKSLNILPFNSVNDINKINGDIAAIILEPVASHKFLKSADQEFLKAIEEKAGSKNIILIVDETNPLPNNNGKYNPPISSDLVCFGGFITAGLGFGILYGKKLILDALPIDSLEKVSPVLLNAGFATIRSLSQPTLNKLLKHAEELERNIKAVIESTGKDFSVFRSHQMLSIKFNNDDQVHKMIHGKCWEHLLQNGIYFSPNPFEPFSVCTKHSRKDINHLVENLKNFIKETA